jgi:hypothetical protein
VEAKGIFRAMFAVICLVGTGLGLANTYGDNTEVKGLAQKTACGSPGCSISVLSETRSAFSQSFGFQTTLAQKGKSQRSASVDVECKRQQVLIGAYECRVTSGGLPGAAPLGQSAP